MCNKHNPDVVLQGAFVLPASCELISLSLFITATHTYTRKIAMNTSYLQCMSVSLPSYNISLPSIISLQMATLQQFDAFTPLSPFHATYIYPVYVTVAGMCMLPITLGACYCITYRRVVRKTSK